MDWKALNPRVIDEFRRNNGKVSGFENLPLIILQTRGARSGRLFDVPLIPVLEADRVFLFGTNAGSASMPNWVHNVRANARITVEYGSEIFLAEIKELPQVEAQARLAEKARQSTQLQDYLRSASPRIVPVFEVIRQSKHLDGR
ncbi:MAG: nitroreductase family deazaflavin-dependent oxidoreductase [Pseudomonadales bacterium]|nr:nitroreductase family deazaflavin-dependent oxidoreductase [Pseudomonadales bacterium]